MEYYSISLGARAAGPHCGRAVRAPSEMLHRALAGGLRQKQPVTLRKMILVIWENKNGL